MAPLEFISYHLNDIQCRWLIYEREMYAVVHVLEKFKYCLRGSMYLQF